MAGTDFSHLTTDELIKGIKALKLPDYIRSKAYGVDVRETLAQMTEMTIQLGVNMGLSPDDALIWARKLQESVSQSEFDSWVATLLDGGPSIFMNTLSELQTTYPNGAPGVALVRETDPAKIYVWNGSAWESFGDYQGIEVKDGSIKTKKIENRAVELSKLNTIYNGGNILASSTPKVGAYVARINGEEEASTDYAVYDFLPTYGSDTLTFNRPPSTLVYNIGFYEKNSTNSFISGFQILSSDTNLAVPIPENANYFKISVPTSDIKKCKATLKDISNINDDFYGYGTGTKHALSNLVTHRSSKLNSESIMKTGAYISQDSGLAVANSYHVYYENIDISGVLEIEFFGYITSQVNGAFFDEAGQFLTGFNVQPNSETTKITVPRTAMNLKYSHITADLGKVDCYISGKAIGAQSGYYPKGLALSLGSNLETITSDNLIDTSDYFEGYTVSLVNGSLIKDDPESAEGTNATSKLFKVNDTNQIVIKKRREYASRLNVVFFDEKYNFISSKENKDLSFDVVVNVPKDAYVAQVSMKKGDFIFTNVQKGNSLTQDNSYFNYPLGLAMPNSVYSDISADEIKVKMGHVEYQIKNEVKPYTDGGVMQNQDVWRIVGVKIKGFEAYRDGAFETAIQISGLPDFTGTYHGYEKTESVGLYADNKKVSLGKINANKFSVITRGYLVRQGTEDENICDFVRVYDFENGKLKLTQKFNWNDDFTFNNAYITMLPIKRTLNSDGTGLNVTNTLMSSHDYIEYDVSTDNPNIPIKTRTKGVGTVQIWGENIGVKATVKIKDPNIEPMVYLWQAPQYNKVYFSYGQNFSVNNGDKWEIETTFENY